jgi:hypothetical protein
MPLTQCRVHPFHFLFAGSPAWAAAGGWQRGLSLLLVTPARRAGAASEVIAGSRRPTGVAPAGLLSARISQEGASHSKVLSGWLAATLARRKGGGTGQHSQPLLLYILL